MSKPFTADASADLDPRTPVIIGVGQSSERIDDPDYQGLSPVDLAVSAVRDAFADAGIDSSRDIGLVDVIAATRSFEDSVPGAPSPLGKSTKFPVSVANRLGASPRRSILEVAGGQSPQHLLTEFAAEILAGRADFVVLTGAEAISTIRHLSTADDRPDFSDDPVGDMEDRGFGLHGLTSMEQAAHGMTSAPVQYAILENARRAATGMTRAEQTRAMAELFAPLSEVASRNPHSAAPEARSIDELAEVTERNRPIADPYTRFLVSRDQVNQGAAVVLTSIQGARSAGVAPARWVFLHGRSDLTERTLLDRESLSSAPSAPAAVRAALDTACTTLDSIDHIDLYSCFPIAVSNIADALGLRHDDPRGLTLTGGLPFFGGAGNNYSMHAIAEAVSRVREAPGTTALVSANGGVLSKTSVGVYSTVPAALPAAKDDSIQRELDAVAAPEHVQHAQGWATIEGYTVAHSRSGTTGIVVARLEDGGGRFVAKVAEGDDELLARLESDPEPIGLRVHSTGLAYGNRVTTDDLVAQRLFPTRTPSFRDDYEFVSVRRDGHLLEVTINRPDARNALHPPAHEELAEIFDAYFADRDLWVAIITGAGDRSFCAGNDLTYNMTGKQVYVPFSGFGGLTSRRGMDKPVIAAVNGFAMGGGFEIALACHLVVADEGATFALSEVKVGLVAGAGGAVRLPRKVPRNVATEMILTGRRIDAQEASTLGVVSRVAPAGEVMTVARDLAREIIAGSPTSVRLSLRLMEQTDGVADTIDAVATPTELIDELLLSHDAVEGMTAFATKRTPEWRNR